MKRFWQISLATLLSLGSYCTANAQLSTPPGPPSPGNCDTIVGSAGGYYGNYGWHASTEAEGYYTGQARLLQGAGDYNKNTAAAMVLREQARGMYQDNYRDGLKTYFDLKRINADYRAETAPAPLTKEKLDEWNKQDQPSRLTKREYNSDSGQVRWPSVLMTPAFDNYRAQVEELFARRTANEYGLTSDFYRSVQRDTTAMQTILKAHLKSEDRFFTDGEYMAAKNFLASLAHEARLAPDLDGLVAN
ncbi:hypothetical protein [Anatilimnocola floriformis]|uniref:hypothetical protein n=1 Tax=Anatilimnocola floriformis TaxID=2948575 RepID=UPI0020C3F93C|nr:hypothetical protein [Anatilimnocola floriformis]